MNIVDKEGKTKALRRLGVELQSAHLGHLGPVWDDQPAGFKAGKVALAARHCP